MNTNVGFLDGGAEGIRTPDPHNAIVVLYQLSYDPIQSEKSNVPAPFVKTFALLFCLSHELIHHIRRNGTTKSLN